MNRLLGHIKWLLRSRRTRRLDEKAMAIADKYGMRKQYLEARKFGFSPLEALEEWDLIEPEERAVFLEPHCGLDPQSLAQNNMKNKTKPLWKIMLPTSYTSLPTSISKRIGCRLERKNN